MTEPILRWYAGRGWLVLSGGNTAGSPLRAQALERAIAADAGVVYLTLNPDDTSVLDDLDDLGAPTGYTPDLLREPDEVIERQIQEASMVMIEGADNPLALKGMLSGPVLNGVKAALENGAIVFAEGLAAHVLGALVITPQGLVKGAGLVENALILPAMTSLTESPTAHKALVAHPDILAISIARGSALALGSQNRLETWGQRQITITLGQQNSTS